MHIHNWFGLPAWVLASERTLRQALEVYSGRQVSFEFFRAKTLKAGEDPAWDDVTFFWRSVAVEATVLNFEGGVEHRVTAQFRLKSEHKKGRWKVTTEYWKFHTNLFTDFSTSYTVDPRCSSDVATQGPFERIQVSLSNSDPRNNRWFAGAGIKDRTEPAH